MSRLDQVVFFSKRDLASQHMLERAQKLLDSNQDFSKMDLNSLLEFHHVHLYFENELFLTSWTKEQKTSYRQIVKTAISELRDYFFNIPPGSLTTEINNLDFNNKQNFWILFQYFEVQKRIDRSVFIDTLATIPWQIRYILTLKQLVQYYNMEIRSFLMTYNESAELLLSHYEEKSTNNSSAYIFPKSLSDADKQMIIDSYLSSEDANLNFVELVRNSRHIKLTPQIMLKAKRTSENIKEQYFTDANSTKISVGASLNLDQKEPVIFENKDSQTTAIYGCLYLDALKAETELFNIFSSLFLYVNEDGLIELVNKDAQMDTLEKMLMQSKNEYHTGMAFARKDMMSLAQLGIMCHYLTRSNRSIETLIQNFVKVFFEEKCKIEGLNFEMPAASLSPSEKIKLIAPEMEYLLKQFKNLAVDGHIDHELLQIDSTPVNYSDIPSLLKKKYIVSSDPVMLTLQHVFFDSNSILADLGKNRNTNLFQALVTEKLLKSDFENYQQDYLEQLIKDGFLTVTENGVIELVDPVMIFIAGKLHQNSCLSYWHYPPFIQAEIDRLVDQGLLAISNDFFTKEEVSYLNFYMNKKEFSNGKDLRNKYLHGSNNRDLKKQEVDYLYFLRTCILILLKLQDDFALWLNNRNL